MVLCYARMRIRMPEGEWFTRSDYYEFQVGKISRSNIKEYTLRLTRNGLLECHPNRISWRLTDKGHQAIRDIDRQFAVLNPHGNSHTPSAIHARNKQLHREEERLLDRLTGQAPTVTK